MEVDGFVYLTELVPKQTMQGGTSDDLLEKYDAFPLLMKLENIDYVTIKEGFACVQCAKGIGLVMTADTIEEIADRMNKAQGA